jgi:hypothetical protein
MGLKEFLRLKKWEVTLHHLPRKIAVPIRPSRAQTLLDGMVGALIQVLDKWRRWEYAGDQSLGARSRGKS